MPASPKVIILVGSLAKGGAERQAVMAGKALLAAGAQVEYLCIQPGGEQYPMPEGATRTDIDVKSIGLFKGWKESLKHIKAQQPDCMITFTLPANSLGRMIKLRMRSIRLITSIRTSRVEGMHRRILSFTKGLDSATVFNSKAVKDSCCDKGITLADRAKVICNAVSMPDPQPGARASLRGQLGLKESDFLWGTIGRMELVKDHQMLLASGKESWLERSHFLIVGEGPLRGEIEAMAAEMGAADRLHLPGRQSNISDWCAAMDAFVLSSKWEGMPNALLEGMFCGLPCVSTDVGGAREILLDGQHGLIVPPEDAKSMGEALTTMMDMDSQKRREMAEGGQKHVRNVCSPEVIDRLWVDAALSSSS